MHQRNKYSYCGNMTYLSLLCSVFQTVIDFSVVTQSCLQFPGLKVTLDTGSDVMSTEVSFVPSVYRLWCSKEKFQHMVQTKGTWIYRYFNIFLAERVKKSERIYYFLLYCLFQYYKLHKFVQISKWYQNHQYLTLFHLFFNEGMCLKKMNGK